MDTSNSPGLFKAYKTSKSFQKKYANKAGQVITKTVTNRRYLPMKKGLKIVGRVVVDRRGRTGILPQPGRKQQVRGIVPILGRLNTVLQKHGGLGRLARTLGGRGFFNRKGAAPDMNAIIQTGQYKGMTRSALLSQLAAKNNIGQLSREQRREKNKDWNRRLFQ